jgi:hypothetical protein
MLRSVHSSFSRELQLLSKFFIDEEYDQSIGIIPVADPISNSTLQRALRAQVIMNIASQYPEFHNIKEVLIYQYESQGLGNDDIRRILKPEFEEERPIERDPVSENIAIMQNEPVSVYVGQDHDAHNIIHYDLLARNKNLPEDLVAAVQAHIWEHEIEKYKLSIEQMLGEPLLAEQLDSVEMQNHIALVVASKISERIDQEDAELPPAPLDPNAVWLSEIEQKAEEVKSKERMAEKKNEIDVFKTQLGFEEAKLKTQSSQEIAEQKAEIDLIKHGNKG